MITIHHSLNHSLCLSLAHLNNWKCVKGWKAERLKGWKAERLKGWKAERLKGWKVQGWKSGTHYYAKHSWEFFAGRHVHSHIKKLKKSKIQNSTEDQVCTPSKFQSTEASKNDRHSVSRLFTISRQVAKSPICVWLNCPEKMTWPTWVETPFSKWPDYRIGEIWTIVGWQLATLSFSLNFLRISK